VPAPTPAAGGSGAAGNGQGGDDGAGSNAAPGAGRTPVQSVPTGGVRSAADTSMLVPGRRLILLAAGMVSGRVECVKCFLPTWQCANLLLLLGDRSPWFWYHCVTCILQRGRETGGKQ
jgi:hypothetical protein